MNSLPNGKNFVFKDKPKFFLLGFLELLLFNAIFFIKTFF